MAVTAASAEPLLQNLTTTTISAPYSSSAAPSMADSLPALNFGFDDLRARMSSFTKRFDEFIEQGRRRVLEERNQFRMSVAEVQDQQAHKEREIAALSATTSQHAQTLSSQSAEAEELHAAIATLTTSRDSYAGSVASLKTRLGAVREAIAARKTAQRERQAYLAHQASFDAPELEFWERYLGLRIEGTGEGSERLRFVFSGLDERRPTREASFELELGDGAGAGPGSEGDGYEVLACRPKLDDAAVERCLGCMRESEDLAGFLKGMRALFATEIRK